MSSSLSFSDAIDFWRMGLVTGFVSKEQLIAWADRQILNSPAPRDALFDLSLSSSRPYSELLWLLNSFHGAPDYGLALNMIFAQAGWLLEEGQQSYAEIIHGLGLLREEEYFPAQIESQLTDLKELLFQSEGGDFSEQEVCQALILFLASYDAYHQYTAQLLLY